MAKRKHKKKPIKAVKQRNVVALNPLMRKGGHHEKAEKHKRVSNKIKLKKEWSSTLF